MLRSIKDFFSRLFSFSRTNQHELDDGFQEAAAAEGLDDVDEDEPTTPPPQPPGSRQSVPRALEFGFGSRETVTVAGDGSGESEESDGEAEADPTIVVSSRTFDADDEAEVQPAYRLLDIPTILYLFEFFLVQLEEEDVLYEVSIFYGYFLRDPERTLHLLFCSFHFETEGVCLRSLPFRRMRHLHFDFPTLVNSKYLADCASLSSLINVKINKRTIPALANAYHCLERFDFRLYNLSEDTMVCLNRMTRLEFLKLNFRKKLANRTEIHQELTDCSELQVLELWNTSSYQFLRLPSCFYTSFVNFPKLRNVCIVRVRFSPKQLSLMLQVPSLVDFEYLGELTNDHFEVFSQNRSLRRLNISGCIVEEEYIKIFTCPSLIEINVSSIGGNLDALHYATFHPSSACERLNLNRLKKIPTPFIETLCQLPALRSLHLERAGVNEGHLQLIRSNAEWANEVDIFLDLDALDEGSIEETKQFRIIPLGARRRCQINIKNRISMQY